MTYWYPSTSTSYTINVPRIASPLPVTQPVTPPAPPAREETTMHVTEEMLCARGCALCADIRANHALDRPSGNRYLCTDHTARFVQVHSDRTEVNPRGSRGPRRSGKVVVETLAQVREAFAAFVEALHQTARADQLCPAYDRAMENVIARVGAPFSYPDDGRPLYFAHITQRLRVYAPVEHNRLSHGMATRDIPGLLRREFEEWAAEHRLDHHLPGTVAAWFDSLPEDRKEPEREQAQRTGYQRTNWDPHGYDRRQDGGQERYRPIQIATADAQPAVEPAPEPEPEEQKPETDTVVINGEGFVDASRPGSPDYDALVRAIPPRAPDPYTILVS